MFLSFGCIDNWKVYKMPTNNFVTYKPNKQLQY
jgi:hypothetical protein